MKNTIDNIWAANRGIGFHELQTAKRTPETALSRPRPTTLLTISTHSLMAVCTASVSLLSKSCSTYLWDAHEHGGSSGRC